MLKEQFNQKLLDLLVTAAALLLAYWLWILWPGSTWQPPEGLHLPFLLLATLVSCGISYHYFGCYEFHSRQVPFDKVFTCIAKSVLFGATGVILLLYLVGETVGSQLIIGLFVVFDISLLTAFRASIHSRRQRGLNHREILVIGSRERARELIRYVTASEELGYHLIGCLEVDPDLIGTEVAEGVKVVGGMSEFRSILLDRAVDEVIFAIPLVKVENVLDYIGFAEEQGVNVRVLPDWQIPELMYQPKVASVHIDQFAGLPTLVLSSVPRKQLSLLIKSLLDRSLAAIGLLVLSPLFILIAVIIKASSRGPVFFRQERCGLNGRRFTLYKFRTMVAEAEALRMCLQAENEMDGPVFKMENDPRITAVGRILRKTSLDELPQLINILRGEMSIVGPRPPLPAEVKEYSHWQRRRLSMRPGLTCIWQVSGRNDVRFEDWMRMDLEYIDNWSLLLDLKLLVKTVPVVISGTGR